MRVQPHTRTVDRGNRYELEASGCGGYRRTVRSFADTKRIAERIRRTD